MHTVSSTVLRALKKGPARLLQNTGSADCLVMSHPNSVRFATITWLLPVAADSQCSGLAVSVAADGVSDLHGWSRPVRLCGCCLWTCLLSCHHMHL